MFAGTSIAGTGRCRERERGVHGFLPEMLPVGQGRAATEKGQGAKDAAYLADQSPWDSWYLVNLTVLFNFVKFQNVDTKNIWRDWPPHLLLVRSLLVRVESCWIHSRFLLLQSSVLIAEIKQDTMFVGWILILLRGWCGHFDWYVHHFDLFITSIWNCVV